MKQQITNIRMHVDGISTGCIYEVLLSSKDVCSINLLIEYIDMGVHIYYINKRKEEVRVESFHPLYKDPFIRSENHVGVLDELLYLPLF